MRNAIFCAASLALAIVAADQVVAGSTVTPANQMLSVDRSLKGDRAHMSGLPAEPGPATTLVPKSDKAEQPFSRHMPEGCEASVSPLAKAADSASAALCLA
jgi:hypothetical protein